MLNVDVVKRRQFGSAILYSTTIFTGAFLLFWVQPFTAKLLLPVYGGVPEVWGSCIVFFQIILLLAYAYVYLSNRYLNIKFQAAIHVTLLVTVVVLSIPLKTIIITTNGLPPIISVFLKLLLILGLPAFVLSATSPMLQQLFARTSFSLQRSPYSLYVASNAGSMIAILGYPFIIEPVLTLPMQGGAWNTAFRIYAGLTLICIVTSLIYIKQVRSEQSQNILVSLPNITNSTRLRWLCFSAIPSSLLLGSTNYITLVITSNPLLWVFPLALYLLTLIIAFSPYSDVVYKRTVLLLPGIVILMVLTLASEATNPAWALVLLHMVGLFVLSMVAHHRLADSRPDPTHLSEFYCIVSLGGAIGGSITLFLAPHFMDRLWEYPLAILLACLVCPAYSIIRSGRWEGLKDLGFAILVGVVIYVMSLISSNIGLKEPLTTAITFGIPLLAVNHLFTRDSSRFVSILTAVLIAGIAISENRYSTIYANRNFFGILRVARDGKGSVHSLFHGNTIHGKQFTDVQRRCRPISYYDPLGPVGDIFKAFKYSTAPRNVAVVGLGIGTIVSYGESNQNWTFYELNSEVKNIAENPAFFTYLTECATTNFNIVIGDARKQFSQAKNNSFGLIVLDAFNSDTVPTHLLTKEAMEMYLSKLGDDGVIAVNISNRSMDLKPIISSIAASLGAECLWRFDSKANDSLGKEPSEWAAIVRRTNSLGSIAALSQWQHLSPDSKITGWTDDYASIIQIIRWR